MVAASNRGLGKGLGKGLDSMIPPIKEKKESKENVSHETLVGINEIEPNKLQPRKKIDEDTLHELAASIKEYGIIQPLVVQKKDKFYEIIAGERRWRAARLAGLKKVPVIIKNYTEQEIVEISIIENIQREDLNPIEEALAYQRLIAEFHLKQDEVAQWVAKSRTAITNSMRLLKLSEKVQEMLIEDIISSGHARALIPIEDEELQLNTAMKILDNHLSVRETEKLVKKILSKKEIPQEKVKKDDNDFIYRDLEEKMKSVIGSKVSINRKTNDKGKISIEYYSKEELERITELLFSIK